METITTEKEKIDLVNGLNRTMQYGNNDIGQKTYKLKKV